MDSCSLASVMGWAGAGAGEHITLLYSPTCSWHPQKLLHWPLTASSLLSSLPPWFFHLTVYKALGRSETWWTLFSTSPAGLCPWVITRTHLRLLCPVSSLTMLCNVLTSTWARDLAIPTCKVGFPPQLHSLSKYGIASSLLVQLYFGG